MFNLKYKSLIIPLLLLFLALALRLAWIDLTILSGDMFRDIENSDISSNNLRFVGVTKGVGEDTPQTTFGPSMFYIISFFKLFSDNILIVPIFVAILNSIAVVICFFLCKKYFNNAVAIIASLLYAVNPWHVYISHTFWNPNFLPFFSVIFFYFLFGYIKDKKDSYLIATVFILSLMLTPLFLIPVIFLSILFFRRDTKYYHYFYSALAFIVPFIPYLIFNLRKNISLLGPILYGVSRESSSFLISFLEGFGIPVMLATNYLGKYVYGSSNIFPNIFFEYLFLIITILLVILFILSLVYMILKIRKSGFYDSSLYIIILLILFLPSFFQFIRFKGISPHYYFLLYPIQFIILALFLSFLYNKFKNFKIISISVFIILLILLTFNIYLLYSYVDKNGTTEGGQFSLSYSAKMGVLNYILNNSQDGKINIIFFRAGKDFIPLFDRESNFRINPITYFNISEFELNSEIHGFLVLDRKSLHKSPDLTSQENAYFNSLPNKTIIKGVEIYEI